MNWADECNQHVFRDLPNMASLKPNSVRRLHAVVRIKFRPALQTEIPDLQSFAPGGCMHCLDGEYGDIRLSEDGNR